MANQDMNREETRGTTRTSAELARLSDLRDYKVADGDADIRKWDVRTAEGTKLGKVHDLIVDTREMKVRYIDAELDRKAIGTDKDRHTLIPIGTARLNDRDDDVIINQLPSNGFSNAPLYDHGLIRPEDESSILGAYGGSANRDQLLGDRQFWGSRRTGRENDAYFTRSEEELSVNTRQRKVGKEAKRDEKVVEADLERERIDVESKRNPESRR